MTTPALHAHPGLVAQSVERVKTPLPPLFRPDLPSRVGRWFTVIGLKHPRLRVRVSPRPLFSGSTEPRGPKSYGYRLPLDSPVRHNLPAPLSAPSAGVVLTAHRLLVWSRRGFIIALSDPEGGRKVSPDCNRTLPRACSHVALEFAQHQMGWAAGPGLSLLTIPPWPFLSPVPPLYRRSSRPAPTQSHMVWDASPDRHSCGRAATQPGPQTQHTTWGRNRGAPCSPRCSPTSRPASAPPWPM